MWLSKLLVGGASVGRANENDPRRLSDDYPKEWIYGANGDPKCTAFDDINEPKKIPRCKNTKDLFE